MFDFTAGVGSDLPRLSWLSGSGCQPVDLIADAPGSRFLALSLCAENLMLFLSWCGADRSKALCKDAAIFPGATVKGKKKH